MQSNANVLLRCRITAFSRPFLGLNSHFCVNSLHFLAGLPRTRQQAVQADLTVQPETGSGPSVVDEGQTGSVRELPAR